MCCGRLGHSMFHNLLEYLQPIELGNAHREVSLHRRICKVAQKGTFLLGAMGASLYSLYIHTVSPTYTSRAENVVLEEQGSRAL
jgi:hypothetical protein